MVVEDLHDLIRLLEQYPDWRAELRRVLLGDELLQLPELVRQILQILQRHSEILERHSQAIESLLEAQRRTDQRMEELIEAQRRTDQRMEELAGAQQQMALQLARLVDWQRGEAGRREGEQYEAQTVRRAVNVFMGGRGGSPAEPQMREQLGKWLTPYYEAGEAPELTADPALADIIWWKNGEVFVVEVSLKVDGEDVRRARLRAETLR
ncbi:MAG: hypothetical protein RMM08_08150, partial [Armatimonadota bacterium]|nr:hypothetical protein [Armatimonadota bacterium]